MQSSITEAPKKKFDWSWARFGYGVVGAMAPEIYRITREKDISLISAHPFLIVMSVAMVLIGGVFANAWDDDHAIKCIYIGSTFPLWLSAWTHFAVH